MSVVNKMLKDLEARQAQPNSLNADYQAPQKPAFKIWHIVVVTLVVIAVYFLLFTDTLTNVFTKINPEPSVSMPIETPNGPQIMLVTQKSDIQKVNPKQVQNEEVSAEAAPKVNTTSIAAATPQPEIEKLTSPEKITAPTTQPPKTDDNNDAKQQSSFAMVSSSEESQATSLKAQISESLAGNDITQASKLLNQLISEEPKNLAARKKLASLHFARGNYQQSTWLLLKSIEQFPEQGDLRLMLARLYVVENKPEDAINLLTAFQPSQDIRLEYLAYRAALARQLNRNAVAKVDYQILTQADPKNAKWWLGLGIVNDKVGNLAHALTAYQQASSIGTLDVSVEEFVRTRISILAED